ncbi:MAG: glycosyltransferase [Armatimonadota bacterium]
MHLSCSVIISAYNNFPLLQKALWGYEMQTYTDFDLFIADDGSNAMFSDQLSQFAASSALRIKHIWHPDDGFRKCTILNTAIRACQSEYLVFTDADIIPREDFIANHVLLARRGFFLTGGSPPHCELPQEIHKTLTREDVRRQVIFDSHWLRQYGVTSVRVASRVAFRGVAARICDALTPRPDAFVGCNASAFRDDVLAVKGFDESFVYGGLDRDIGIRLANYGVHGVQHKYSLCGMHLEHNRPYRDEETVTRQKQLFRRRKQQCTVLPDKSMLADDPVLPIVTLDSTTAPPDEEQTRSFNGRGQ